MYVAIDLTMQIAKYIKRVNRLSYQTIPKYDLEEYFDLSAFGLLAQHDNIFDKFFFLAKNKMLFTVRMAKYYH